MEQAIKKAIEGGWAPFGSIKTDGMGWGIGEVYANFYHQPVWLLDPLFWVSLGKAEGWSETVIEMQDGIEDHSFMGGTLGYPYDEGSCMTYKVKTYIYHQHRFIDHLNAGKDVDSFSIRLLESV